MPHKDVIADILALKFSLDKAEVAALSAETCEQWDSLKHLMIIFEVEDALNVKFDEAQIPHLKSYQALVAASEAQLNAS